MAEVSLTKWLDPAFEYFARQAGIPIDQYSAQVGGEGIGVALETVTDFFTKGWLNKAIQFVAGLIADAYAIWGKDVPTRLRRELLALGTHELLRFVDPKPSDIIEVRLSIENTVNALRRGDWNAFFASILRSPAELQAMLGVVAPAPARTMGASMPISTGGTRYSVTQAPPKAPATPPAAPPTPPPTPPAESAEKRYEVKPGSAVSAPASEKRYQQSASEKKTKSTPKSKRRYEVTD